LGNIIPPIAQNHPTIANVFKVTQSGCFFLFGAFFMAAAGDNYGGICGETHHKNRLQAIQSKELTPIFPGV